MENSHFHVRKCLLNNPANGFRTRWIEHYDQHARHIRANVTQSRCNFADRHLEPKVRMPRCEYGHGDATAACFHRDGDRIPDASPYDFRR